MIQRHPLSLTVIGTGENMARSIGVITGDLYRSTAGYERGITYQTVMSMLESKIRNNPRFDVADIDFFRGDSFQITLYNPASLLEIAVYVRTYLIALTESKEGPRLDARLSMSIFASNKSSSFSESVFEQAHIASGRSLDKMKKSSMLAFSSDNPVLAAPLQSVSVLLDTLLSTLSRPQAEVLYRSLEEMTINTSALAAEMGTSRQNIHKLVVRSGTENILESLITMREFMTMEL